MDINKLTYFFASAETGNFTKAAEKCHIAQTTMSKYISSLEKEAGFKIFTRSSRGMVLTSKGQNFYDGMKEIYERYESLIHRLVPALSSITIGLDSQEYRGIDFMPAFLKEFPEITINYRIEPPEVLENELASHRIDAIIAPEAISFSSRFISFELALIPQSLVCSREKAEALKDIKSIISSLPFLTKAENPGYIENCRQKFMKSFDITFSSTEKVPTYSEQLLRLSLGEGFAILPIKPGSGYDDLHAFALDHSFAERTCLICRKDEHSPFLRKLIYFTHEKKC